MNVRFAGMLLAVGVSFDVVGEPGRRVQLQKRADQRQDRHHDGAMPEAALVFCASLVSGRRLGAQR